MKTETQKKAEELALRFSNPIYQPEVITIKGKRAAILHVKGIIEVLNRYLIIGAGLTNFGYQEMHTDLENWQEVLKELEG